MRFSRALARQLARPSGLGGRLLGGVMDIVNRGPARLAIDLLAPAKDERILDAGCGTGMAMRQVLHRAPCRITGIDPSAEMVRIARERLRGEGEVIQSAIEEMPFGAATFDAVLALNVLYFCDMQGKMLENLHRVLRPGGRFVAYVTDRKTMQNWHFAREGYHRLFDAAELADAIAQAGFDPERITVHERRITRSVTGLFAHAIRSAR